MTQTHRFTEPTPVIDLASLERVRPVSEEWLMSDALEMIVDDVTQIAQRVPFIEVAPARLFDVGLVAELADATDRLAAKVAQLQEALGATR